MLLSIVVRTVWVAIIALYCVSLWRQIREKAWSWVVFDAAVITFGVLAVLGRIR